jgi:hypothetical protein
MRLGDGLSVLECIKRSIQLRNCSARRMHCQPNDELRKGGCGDCPPPDNGMHERGKWPNNGSKSLQLCEINHDGNFARPADGKNSSCLSHEERPTPTQEQQLLSHEQRPTPTHLSRFASLLSDRHTTAWSHSSSRVRASEQ